MSTTSGTDTGAGPDAGPDDVGVRPTPASVRPSPVAAGPVAAGPVAAGAVAAGAVATGSDGPTGDPHVDAALTRLDGLADAPLREHVAAFDAVHGALQDRLADAEGAGA